MKKNVALLATCQALLQSCNALLVASSGLVSLALAPSPSFATVALGIQFLATMSLTLPASLLMRRIGRRQGFLIGTALGFVGGVLFSLGIFLQNYGLFCAGAASFGAFNAFGQYYRFAAADVASEDFRSRAISLVLAGGDCCRNFGPESSERNTRFGRQSCLSWLLPEPHHPRSDFDVGNRVY
jgi:MFS family permease